MTKPRRFIAILTTLVLVLAACADDGTDSDSAAAETPTESASAESTATDGDGASSAALPTSVPDDLSPEEEAELAEIQRASSPDPDIDCLDLDADKCAEINEINCIGWTEEQCRLYREQERDFFIDYDPTQFAFGQMVEITDDGLNPRKIDGLVDDPIGWTNNSSEPVVIEFLNGEPIEGLADTGVIEPGAEFTFEITYARSIWYRIQGTDVEGIFEVDNPQGDVFVLD
jgi:hypothetical protein